MTTIRDFESEWLSAQVEFDQWLVEFMQEFTEPTMMMIEKQKIRMSNPEEVQVGERIQTE